LIHDDTTLVHVRNMISRVSYQIVEEIEINSETVTEKADNVRMGILPKLGELCNIIMEASLGLNY
jgi:hypothetical protein